MAAVPFGPPFFFPVSFLLFSFFPESSTHPLADYTVQSSLLRQKQGLARLHQDKGQEGGLLPGPSCLCRACPNRNLHAVLLGMTEAHGCVFSYCPTQHLSNQPCKAAWRSTCSHVILGYGNAPRMSPFQRNKSSWNIHGCPDHRLEEDGSWLCPQILAFQKAMSMWVSEEALCRHAMEGTWTWKVCTRATVGSKRQNLLCTGHQGWWTGGDPAKDDPHPGDLL